MHASSTGGQQRTRVEPTHFAKRRRRSRRLLGLHSLTARKRIETGVSNSSKTGWGCGFRLRSILLRLRLDKLSVEPRQKFGLSNQFGCASAPTMLKDRDRISALLAKVTDRNTTTARIHCIDGHFDQ